MENETGVQGSAREHSTLAEQLFAKTPPQGLVDYLENHTDEMDESLKNVWQNQNAGAERKITPDSGQDGMEKCGKEKGWREVFGLAADEIFSAYHIASYVEYVAAAGKAEYDLPMAVNSWLTQGTEPGVYPSGGPVAKMMEVWIMQPRPLISMHRIFMYIILPISARSIQSLAIHFLFRKRQHIPTVRQGLCMQSDIIMQSALHRLALRIWENRSTLPQHISSGWM